MTSLLERLRRLRFQQAVKAMLDTPAVTTGTAPFTALSMVHHRDVLPYLLAIKSFASVARPQRIVLVADPTLDETDRALVARHVRGIQFLEAARFQRAAIPRGGTWERLAAIAELCAETSVVQLDADTVTYGEPTEVVQAATQARSFVIRSEAGIEIVDLERATETGRRLLQDSRHIQAVAESRLAELSNAAARRYARGCSGFTGFGRGAISPAQLDEVSGEMRALHGARWDEWGTEQVTSNLLAASAPGAFMLPHPRYCNADSRAADTVVAHFIGYARYVDSSYQDGLRQVVQRLRRAA